MPDFLASKMHQRYLPGPQVLLLAPSVIFQSKEYVDGCGGDRSPWAANPGSKERTGAGCRRPTTLIRWDRSQSKGPPRRFCIAEAGLGNPKH
jgi:hypothetical protein